MNHDEILQAAEFNFEQYQDVGRLLHEECEKSERLESKLANLQPQAEALHKVASAIGFEAGEDVTMAPIVVRAIKSNFDKLEQAHQELLAERDDWRTYALEAGAQKIRTQQELHEVKRQRDELLAALENCRLLAARHRKEEWAGHVLRFCGEAGVAGEVMR